jgi:hypothetical protein
MNRWTRKKLKLAKRYGLHCYWCGCPIKLEGKMKERATIDHFIPKSKGGSKSDIGNLVLSCFSCNNKKSDSIPLEKSPIGFFAEKTLSINNNMILSELAFELKESGFPQENNKNAYYWIRDPKDGTSILRSLEYIRQVKDMIFNDSDIAYAPSIEELLCRVWIEAHPKPVVIEAR